MTNKVRFGRKFMSVDRYVELANLDGRPCKYGHLSCAAWFAGPCSDELLSRKEAKEEECECTGL